MNYLKKTQHQHGYRDTHVVPKDVTILPDLNLGGGHWRKT
jgi:hypothetical protein